MSNGALEVRTDLGKGAARTEDAVPRHRGGAHAAAKTGRFRRKSRPASAPRSAADPAPSPRRAADQTPASRPAADPAPASWHVADRAAASPPVGAPPPPLTAPVGEVRANGSQGLPGTVPRPRGTGASSSRRPRQTQEPPMSQESSWSPGPITAPSPPAGSGAPAVTAGAVTAGAVTAGAVTVGAA